MRMMMMMVMMVNGDDDDDDGDDDDDDDDDVDDDGGAGHARAPYRGSAPHPRPRPVCAPGPVEPVRHLRWAFARPSPRLRGCSDVGKLGVKEVGMNVVVVVVVVVV